MAIRAEKRLEKVREYYTTKNRTEIAEVEERKNVIIDKLKTGQKEALREMKNYYSDIVNNNLTLISALKEELLDLKKDKDETEVTVKKLTEENKKLTKPLEQARARVAELEKLLEDNKKNKTSLNNIHARYNEMATKLDDVTLERDSLEIKIEKLQFEIDELKTQYTVALAEAQKKSGLRSKVLEERIVYLEEEAERREILMAQTVSKANLEPNAVAEANKQIREIMVKRAKRLETLKLELGRAVRNHDLMLEDFREKAAAYNIPEDEVSYRPLRPRLRTVLRDDFQTFDLARSEDEIRPLDL